MNPTPEDHTPQSWPYTEGPPPAYPQYQPQPWDTPARPLPGFWLALLLCLLFLLVTQLPGAILGAVLLVVLLVMKPGGLQAGGDPNEMLGTPEASLAMGVALAFTQVLVITFSLLVLWFVLGRDWRRKVALRWPGWSVTLFALASVPAFIFLANLGVGYLRKVLPVGENPMLPGMEKLVEMFHKWPTAFGILVVGFGPGIGEELWCRAFLGRGLVGRYGVWVGVLLTSFFFGAIHVDPVQGTMAMGMGLWLHYVYLTSQSLWMPMLLHTVNNSLAILAGSWTFLSDLDSATEKLVKTGSLVEVLLPTLAALGLLGAIALALYQARPKLVGSGWQQPCPGVECPPADSGTRLLQGRATLVAVGAVVLTCAACVASLVRMVQTP